MSSPSIWCWQRLLLIFFVASASTSFPAAAAAATTTTTASADGDAASLGVRNDDAACQRNRCDVFLLAGLLPAGYSMFLPRRVPNDGEDGDDDGDCRQICSLFPALRAAVGGYRCGTCAEAAAGGGGGGGEEPPTATPPATTRPAEPGGSPHPSAVAAPSPPPQQPSPMSTTATTALPSARPSSVVGAPSASASPNSGTPLAPPSPKFTIIAGGPLPPALQFKLIYTPTGQEVMDLGTTGDAIVDLTQLGLSLPAFNVRAEPLVDGIEAVLFYETERTEEAQPFALCGTVSNNGDDAYVSCATSDGVLDMDSQTTVTATPIQNGFPLLAQNISITVRQTIPSQATYVPGRAVVHENGLVLSQGLTSRCIAAAGQPVTHDAVDGSGLPTRSTEIFHGLPDGAAVFVDPSGTGSYKYVSNSEVRDEGRGGVGAITFDGAGNVIAYERLLSNTTWNCGGGKTWWGTWMSCEESLNGRVYEVDPFGATANRMTVIGGDEGPGRYESAAYDNRSPSDPKFFVTSDKPNGPLLRFTPDPYAVIQAVVSGNYSDLLHTDSDLVENEYLVLHFEAVDAGNFTWTSNITEAEQSAVQHYSNAEGMDVRDGMLYFVAKREKHLFILDLDAQTFVRSSTKSGAFNSGPDQVARLLSDDDGTGILYFCEGGEMGTGVHGRNSDGQFFTILQADEGPSDFDRIDGETSGLAFSPDGKRMYVSFQQQGKIFEIRRTDGRPFGGQRLDIKYHTDPNDDPFVP